MQANNFDLTVYFERIGLRAEPARNIECVAAMMRQQLFTVPFENLDVQAGKTVSLVAEEIVEKIVQRRRGGYCYEVNGLFAMALQALDIPYQFVAARPMFYPVKRPKTHMAVVVQLDGMAWLCDLGFGSYGIRAPLRMDQLDREVRQDGDTFMLSLSGGEYLLQALVEGVWTKQYGFDLAPQDWIDFVPANYLNSTHPDAIFVQKLLIVLHRANGRSILLGDTLKIVADGQVEKRPVIAADRVAVLAGEFGLSAPEYDFLR